MDWSGCRLSVHLVERLESIQSDSIIHILIKRVSVETRLRSRDWSAADLRFDVDVDSYFNAVCRLGNDRMLSLSESETTFRLLFSSKPQSVRQQDSCSVRTTAIRVSLIMEHQTSNFGAVLNMHILSLFLE